VDCVVGRAGGERVNWTHPSGRPRLADAGAAASPTRPIGPGVVDEEITPCLGPAAVYVMVSALQQPHQFTAFSGHGQPARVTQRCARGVAPDAGEPCCEIQPRHDGASRPRGRPLGPAGARDRAADAAGYFADHFFNEPRRRKSPHNLDILAAVTRPRSRIQYTTAWTSFGRCCRTCRRRTAPRPITTTSSAT
jgi:hypothetical protein